jgi:ATP:ADP antiporter, AAA family
VSASEESTHSATLAATIGAALMIAAQVGSKATRDALFLDAFDPKELPKAMLASAVLSPIAVLVMAQGIGRLGPARFVPALFVVNAGLFAAEYALWGSRPLFVAGALYLHVAVLGSLLVSGFWSVVSERFDPHTAKRVIGRISGGATAGGLLGGLCAERVAAWYSAREMLVVLAVMSVVGSAAVWRAGAGAQRAVIEDAGILSGLRVLREAPYLKMLAVLATLTALTSGVLDYAFKAAAAAELTDRESLMSLFAVFYTATGIVTFLAQTLLSQRALSSGLGIGGTIALLPGLVLLGGMVGAAALRLWSVIAVRAIEEVLSNSLFRSSYELLFTPLRPERKRPTKTIIDVGFKRLGDALGSGLVLAVVMVLPSRAIMAALIAAAAASAASLYAALRLHRGYVSELAESLKSGRIALEDADIFDATTRRTLADTTMAINREQLLAQIEELRANAPPPSRRGVEIVAAPVSLRQPSIEEEKLLGAVADLTSGDGARIREALGREIDPRVVGFVVGLLAHDGYARTARRALHGVAKRAVGQLCDALVDPDQPDIVRRRLPEIIARVPSHRSVAGLFEGMASGSAQVRDRCVRALVELVAANPELRPARRDVFTAAERQLDDGEVSLPRLFGLLGLTLDSEPLKLSLAALRSDDASLRGTSFEYLENVLPEDLRVALWPHVTAYARTVPPPRPSKEKRSRRNLVDALQSAERLTLEAEVESAELEE